MAGARDGATLELEDGRVLRLAGLLAPRAGEPFFAQARAGMEDLAAGRKVVVSGGPPRRDRWDRLVVQAEDDTGRWLQGEALRRGLARVATWPDERARATDMLAAEAEARVAGRGLWAEPAYRPLRAEAVRARDGAFHLVEGRVVKVAETRGKTYLNFGADWRTDFTVVLDAASRRLFVAAGRDPATLEGRLVRVRGWLESWNGPLIEASHPEQIEVLE